MFFCFIVSMLFVSFYEHTIYCSTAWNNWYLILAGIPGFLLKRASKPNGILFSTGNIFTYCIVVPAQDVSQCSAIEC
jgi:hypothetical protein